ncbi:XRE family transcriptional regulator [Phytohabitans kaempferiae]|uniref:XRE family transcriptional regulator n=1 Tax=Phytohabitans kaempferiae TaxID=1620943 RepID=A0ABV6M9G6_9ACTN
MLEESAAQSPIAQRLDHLFKTVRGPDGREHTYEEVAVALRAKGVRASHTYVWQLRNGQSDNPGIKVLHGLADFFGVPTNYFTDRTTAKDVDRQLQLIAVMRDHGVRRLALRAFGLSSDTLAAITQLIAQARKLEGLPDDDSHR